MKSRFAIESGYSKPERERESVQTLLVFDAIPWFLNFPHAIKVMFHLAFLDQALFFLLKKIHTIANSIRTTLIIVRYSNSTIFSVAPLIICPPSRVRRVFFAHSIMGFNMDFFNLSSSPPNAHFHPDPAMAEFLHMFINYYWHVNSRDAGQFR